MKQTILCVALMAAASLSAKAQLINIQFGGDDYNSAPLAPVQTGAGIVGSSGDKWNDFTDDSALLDGVDLSDSTGTAITGAKLTVAGAGYNFYPGGTIYQYSDVENLNSAGDTLGSTPVYNLASSELGAATTLTLSFSGLAADKTYSIYMLSAPDNWGRESAWSLNGGTAQDVGPLNAHGSAPTSLVLNTNYLVFTGTTDGFGDLTLKGTSVQGEVDINGLQLVAAVPEPSTYALMITGILGVLAFRFKRCLKA